ncbi:MAG TPA: hypothetical protein VFE42_09935 [Chloroflexota bacterium]|nr:hypothetical protein [Chloroflexota bacterium]
MSKETAALSRSEDVDAALLSDLRAIIVAGRGRAVMAVVGPRFAMRPQSQAG